MSTPLPRSKMFHKVVVDRRIFTNGVKLLIPREVDSADIKPHTVFKAIPDPTYNTISGKLGIVWYMINTGMPDPDSGADEANIWAYPHERNFKFGGEYLFERITPKLIWVENEEDNDAPDDPDEDPYRVGDVGDWK